MDFTHDLERAMEELTTHGAFLSVRGESAVNTMTISWGFIGMIWKKPHFICLIRPQRYTKSVIQTANSFTVSVPFGETLKQELAICGSKSGRDIDKSKVVEFVPAQSVDSPIVKGCDRYYECRICYMQDMDQSAVEPDVLKQFYIDDLHTMYFGEIVQCY